MSELKQILVREVLRKGSNTFTNVDLLDEIGGSKQAIAYHLDRLVACGALSKQGRTFKVADSAALVDHLSTTNYNSPVAKDTHVFSEAKALNGMIKALTDLDALEVPKTNELISEFRKELDYTIEQFKNAKRGLNRNRRSRNAILKRDDLDKLKDQYDALLGLLGVDVDDETRFAAWNLVDEDRRHA